MELPITIELERRERLTLIWEDGERTELTAAPLRKACLCAVCEGTASGWPVPSVTIANIGESGAYGLHLVFASDGHQADIYGYDDLRAPGKAGRGRPLRPAQAAKTSWCSSIAATTVGSNWAPA